MATKVNHSGKVKFYNDTRAYGFITDDNGVDYFFHISGILNRAQIKKDDSVTFELAPAKNDGVKAINIVKV